MSIFDVGQLVQVGSPDAPHVGAVGAVTEVDAGYGIPLYRVARLGWYAGVELVRHEVAVKAGETA